ncbi:hypothetical protein DERP_013779 [Dermatophagoides pteronyssinus]|uniref:Uncharacterized protein n=1 Tax=Dermatophagoides pteronyssinus TaxID=6956 RepID=A0ABQ8JFF6_DERPT|nr:hypothetical protein DERP_013779 [Dermatophagoides pteronyssinus]
MQQQQQQQQNNNNDKKSGYPSIFFSASSTLGKCTRCAISFNDNVINVLVFTCFAINGKTRPFCNNEIRIYFLYASIDICEMAAPVTDNTLLIMDLNLLMVDHYPLDIQLMNDIKMQLE